MFAMLHYCRGSRSTTLLCKMVGGGLAATRVLYPFCYATGAGQGIDEAE